MNLFVKNRAVLICIALAFSFNLKSQTDSVFIAKQVIPWLHANNYFRSNPAAGNTLPYSKMSEVAGSYDYSQADEGLHGVQAGSGISNYRFLAESFKTEGNQRFFGKAYFESGLKKNTAWTDVEDVDLLSPYIVADSVGGTYKSETYFISGGMAWLKKNAEWAIRGEYKGTVSYRNVDPRPKNTVSRLTIQPGFVYKSGDWDYGVGLEYCRYRQNVDIDIEKDSKKIFFYLMQGFGIYNVEFSSFEETFTRDYKGDLFQTAFQIRHSMPDISYGFQLKADYNALSVVEEDERTPYKIKQVFFNPEGNIEKTFGSQTLFADLSYEFRQSTGNETQYEPEVVNVSQVLWVPFSHSDRYRQNTHSAQVNLLIANKDLTRFSFWEKLHASWTDTEQRYVYPDYKQTISDLETNLSIGANLPLKNASLLQSYLEVGYKKNLSASLYQEVNNTITTGLIVPDFDYLSASYSIGKWNVSYGRKLSNRLSAMLSGYIQVYKNSTKDALFAGSSLTFSF